MKGSIKFAFEMIMSDLKQSLCYMIATTIAVSVIFNIFNIIYNKDVMNRELVDGFDISIIALFVIVACVLFISFANSYYIIEKTKDIAIAAISGRSFVEVATILCIQNLGLGLAGSALGLVIGTFLVPLFVGSLYSAMGHVGNTFEICWQGYGFTFLIMGMVFLSVGLIDAGYAYRKEIKELMITKAASLNKEPKPLKKIPNKLYVVLYFFPIIVLFFGMGMRETAIAMGVVISIGVVGAAGIIQFYFPCEIARIRKEKYASNAVKMISLSNLNYSLKRGGFLIVAISVGCVSLIGVAGGAVVEQYKIISLSAYYVVMVLMNIALIYKFIADALTKENTFKQLKLIGYNLNQIKSIIRDEVLLFYGIEIVVTFFLLVLMLVPSGLGGILSIEAALTALISYVVVQLIGVSISYYSYKKIIFSNF
ncbi:MAG: FtsX-like permease family protein [Clostridium sp.]